MLSPPNTPSARTSIELEEIVAGRQSAIATPTHVSDINLPLDSHSLAAIPSKSVSALSHISKTDLSMRNGSGEVHSVSGNSGFELPALPDIRIAGQTSGKTREQARRGRIQFLTLCWTFFLLGWNDGSTGALLPRIQSHYGVGFTTVSLIFIVACVGFCTGAVGNAYFSQKLGFGKLIVLGAICQSVAYCIQAPGPVFAVFVFSFSVNGMGMAIEQAQTNGFVAAIQESPETKMGIIHCAYGLGAFSSPLVATQFAQLERWSFHYLTSLGLSLANVAFLCLIFRFKPQDECLAQMGQAPAERGSEERNHMRQMLSLRTVHLLSSFVFVYTGLEVTIGGWIVTYIMRVRDGGPSAGYISSGFFGGLALGRVALLWVNRKIGENRAIFVYTAFAIGLELIVWFVPSLIGDAVAVALVGVLLGPFYPIAMNRAGRILPHWLLTASIGWVAGLGQAGTALLPFITGALASKFGIKTLQPLLIGLMSFMVVMWYMVPTHTLRRD